VRFSACNNWLGEIEREVMEFLVDRNTVNRSRRLYETIVTHRVAGFRYCWCSHSADRRKKEKAVAL
jgi:hypothetical protein